MMVSLHVRVLVKCKQLCLEYYGNRPSICDVCDGVDMVPLVVKGKTNRLNTLESTQYLFMPYVKLLKLQKKKSYIDEKPHNMKK